MAQLDSTKCKVLIANQARVEIVRIMQLFSPALTAAQAAPACLTRNWKRISKERLPDGSTQRGFDCSPFDDQLRAYVVEKPDGSVTIRIVGE